MSNIGWSANNLALQTRIEWAPDHGNHTGEIKRMLSPSMAQRIEGLQVARRMSAAARLLLAPWPRLGVAVELDELAIK